jgi:hypothetical protein
MCAKLNGDVNRSFLSINGASLLHDRNVAIAKIDRACGNFARVTIREIFRMVIHDMICATIRDGDMNRDGPILKYGVSWFTCVNF